MPLYVLDTDTLSFFWKGHPQVVRRVLACPPADQAVTSVSVAEVLAGWYAALRQAKAPADVATAHGHLARVVTSFSRWTILSLTVAAQARYAQLLALKLNVGGNDLRIAAVALEYGAAVVTHSLRDFRRVPGLTVEDWTV